MNFLDVQPATNDPDAESARILKELTFPFSAKEPDLPQDEMTRLDALADQLELVRLQKLQVLQSLETVPSNSKVLSTRFVRTWCEKHDEKGEAVWLRRSRFVAREFAWLEPERECLFSPASGSIISRMLPTMFLEMKDSEQAILASLDVRDAFLTVGQERPTLVHTTDAQGNIKSFCPWLCAPRTKRWQSALVQSNHQCFEVTSWTGRTCAISMHPEVQGRFLCGDDSC